MRRSLVLLLFSVVSCRPPAEQRSSGQALPSVAQDAAPITSVAATPTSAPVCEVGQGKCISDDTASTCVDGAWSAPQKCDPGSVCLGTGCLALRTLDGRAMDPSVVYAPRGEGWFNAWAAYGPLIGSLPEGQTQIDADAGAEASWKALCSKDGRVDVHDKIERKKGARGTTHYVLSGYLMSGRARPVVFATGFAGTWRLWVNDQRIMSGTRETDPPAFRDEMRATVNLAQGVHRIVVEMEQSTSAPTSFWLRARSVEGGPATDLLFAPDPRATCGATDLLSINVSTRAVADGFSVDVKPSWMGLGPRQWMDVPYEVQLDQKKNGTKVLAQGTLSKTVWGTPQAAFSFAVPLEPAGAHEMQIRLGDAPGATMRLPVVRRPNLHRRAIALANKREFIEQSKATRGEKDSLLFHIDELLNEVSRSDPDTSWIDKRTEEAEQLVHALEHGRSPYADRKGVVRRAYRSPIDGNLQPYALFVPRAYKPNGKPLPLAVAAHGLGNRPEIALRVVVGEAPEGGFQGTHEARHFGGLPDLGVFIVAPWQFGNSGQRHLGEEDLLRVIDEVRAHYPINDKRVSITGYSLGGTVAFVLPLHYPDVFSASAPLCGYPDLLDWSSIRKPAHTPWEDVLLSKRYIVNWAENGLHVPMFMVHGGKDEPRRSELMAKRYQALGYAHELDVQEDLDHNVWDYGYDAEDGDVLRRIIGRKRPDVPEHVRFVTGEWRYDRAYWVRVLGLSSLDKFASVDARYGKKDGTVVVQARNVDSLAIDLKQLGLKKDPRVTINGKAIEVPKDVATAYFVQQGGEFVRVESEPSRAGRKRSGVSGPMDDIDRHSKLIVYGTQDPGQTEENRMVAEHFASFDTFAARFPIKSDAEVTDEEIAAKSLVLIGNSKSNRIVAMMEPSLPVRFEPKAITFRGKRYEGEDVGVSFIFPNPKNDREYVVVHAGVGIAGTLASRHLPRFSPDFLVYDAAITVQRGGHLLDQRKVREGGFFDLEWK